MKTQILVLLLGTGVALALAGCPAPAQHTETPKKTDAHEHDHAHTGPHKGHVVEIGEEEYHAELTHDESGKVTLYILDSEVKKEVPIVSEAIVIDAKIGENAPKSYQLAGVNPMDGKSATFEIVDKEFEALLDQLKSPAIVLTLHVNINGKQFDPQTKDHEHAH